MSNEDQMEFKIGEDEQAADVEVNDETGEAELQAQEQEPIVEQASGQQEEELEQYSDKVKKRIDKMTARLREAQRREDAALEYAKNVQSQLQHANQRYQTSDQHRMAEAKSRIETQSVALKQIVRKAREEGDMDTEMEAQERLSQLVVEQRQLQNYEALSRQQAAQPQPQAAPQQEARPQQPSRPDPKAEQWAEDNPWFGKDTVMTHAAWGIHRQLVQEERLDPQSDEYYDELNRKLRETFPQKFSQSAQNSRSARSAQAVAPANRSSGVNSARRTVRLTPSQVAIAKKLGVPLEEYAKYVKD
jgi:uncharacterized protein YjbJ (UPF0337 family)